MKIWNYVFLLTGISVLFALAGVKVAGMSALLENIGLTSIGTGLGTFAVENTLWDTLFGTKGLLSAITIASAVSVGLYVVTKDKAMLMIPVITGVLVYWGSVMVSIVQQMGKYEIFGNVIGIIGIVLTVGFIVSCVDFFMGHSD